MTHLKLCETKVHSGGGGGGGGKDYGRCQSDISW